MGAQGRIIGDKRQGYRHEIGNTDLETVHHIGHEVVAAWEDSAGIVASPLVMVEVEEAAGLFRQVEVGVEICESVCASPG